METFDMYCPSCGHESSYNPHTHRISHQYGGQIPAKRRKCPRYEKFQIVADIDNKNLVSPHKHGANRIRFREELFPVISKPIRKNEAAHRPPRNLLSLQFCPFCGGRCHIDNTSHISEHQSTFQNTQCIGSQFMISTPADITAYRDDEEESDSFIIYHREDPKDGKRRKPKPEAKKRSRKKRGSVWSVSGGLPD